MSALSRLIGTPTATFRSTNPAVPNVSTGLPVAALSATRWNPGSTTKIRDSRPSVQNETPRPPPFRGALAKRVRVSSQRQRHFSAPVTASTATTARCVPVVKYMTPPIMIGVFSFFTSGGPSLLSVFHVHATASFETLSRVILSSGEYRVAARSRW
jgi:hypothetical protein